MVVLSTIDLIMDGNTKLLAQLEAQLKTETPKFGSVFLAEVSTCVLFCFCLSFPLFYSLLSSSLLFASLECFSLFFVPSLSLLIDHLVLNLLLSFLTTRSPFLSVSLAFSLLSCSLLFLISLSLSSPSFPFFSPLSISPLLLSFPQLDNFKLYNVFCNHQEEAMDTLNRARNRSAQFRQFLDVCWFSYPSLLFRSLSFPSPSFFLPFSSLSSSSPCTLTLIFLYDTLNTFLTFVSPLLSHLLHSHAKKRILGISELWN